MATDNFFDEFFSLADQLEDPENQEDLTTKEGQQQPLQQDDGTKPVNNGVSNGQQSKANQTEPIKIDPIKSESSQDFSEGNDSLLDIGAERRIIREATRTQELAPFTAKPIFTTADITGNFFGFETSNIDLSENGGVNLLFEDINKIKASQQGFGEELLKSTVNLPFNVGLGLLEMGGQAFELGSYILNPDAPKDFTNGFIELTKDLRNPAGEVFRANPNQVLDFTDSAFYVENISNLIESVVEFGLGGAGIAKAVNKGFDFANFIAKGVSKAGAAGRAAKAVEASRGALGTTLTGYALAGSEGMMSGASTFETLKNEKIKKFIKQGLPPKQAREKAIAEASRGASIAALTSTALVGGLNITGVGSLFKSTQSFKTAARLGIAKNATESTSQYLKRLNKFVQNSPANATNRIKKNFSYLLESGQESLEEVLNVYSEALGKSEENLFTSLSTEQGRSLFFDSIFSEEGGLSAVLGAAGGLGQNLFMKRAPLHTTFEEDENGELVKVRKSFAQIEEEQEEKFVQTYASDLQKDLEDSIKIQQDLKVAAENDEDTKVERLKKDLFNVLAKRSFMIDGGDAVIDQLEEIAETDNKTDLGEEARKEKEELQQQLQQLEQQNPDNLTEDQAQQLEVQKQELQKSIDEVAKKQSNLQGVTRAMQAGLTNSPEDNDFKNTAEESISEIKDLKKTFLQLEGDIGRETQAQNALLKEAFDAELNIKNARKSIEETQEFIEKIDTEKTSLIEQNTEAVAAQLDNPTDEQVDAIRSKIEEEISKEFDEVIDKAKKNLKEATNVLEESLKKRKNLKTEEGKNKFIEDLRSENKKRFEKEAEAEDKIDSKLQQDGDKAGTKKKKEQRKAEAIEKISNARRSSALAVIGKKFKDIIDADENIKKQFEERKKELAKKEPKKDEARGSDEAGLFNLTEEEIKQEIEGNPRILNEDPSDEETKLAVENGVINQDRVDSIAEKKIQGLPLSENELTILENKDIKERIDKTVDGIVNKTGRFKDDIKAGERESSTILPTQNPSKLPVKMEDVEPGFQPKVTTAASVAKLQREFDETIGSEQIIRNNKELNEEFNLLISSENHLQAGTELRLFVDEEFEGEVFEDGTRKKRKATFNDLKDNPDKVPIRIQAKIKGEWQDIGFVHETQWVERKENGIPVNIAPKNFVAEVKRIKQLRKTILEKFNKGEKILQGQITNKGTGQIKFGERKKASEALPDSTIQFAVYKGSEFIAGDVPVPVIPRDSHSFIKDGTTHVIVPLANGQFEAIPVFVENNSDQIAVNLARIILAKVQNQTDVIEAINDITFDRGSFSFKQQDGLAKLLGDYLHSRSFSPEVFDQDIPSDVIHFTVSEKTGHIDIARQEDGIIYTTNPRKAQRSGYKNLLQQANPEAILTSLLSDKTFSVKLSNLSTNKPLLDSTSAFEEINIDDNGTVTTTEYESYNAFVKNFISTTLDGTFFINENTAENPNIVYQYTENPSLAFALSGDGNIESTDSEDRGSTDPSEARGSDIAGVFDSSNELDPVTESEPVVINGKEFIPVKDPQEVIPGDVIVRKTGKKAGKEFIVWGITDAGALQLIDRETGVKFSGTPKKSTNVVTESKGTRVTNPNTGNEFIIVGDKIISTTDGKEKFTAKDNSTQKTRELLFKEVENNTSEEVKKQQESQPKTKKESLEEIRNEFPEFFSDETGPTVSDELGDSNSERIRGFAAPSSSSSFKPRYTIEEFNAQQQEEIVKSIVFLMKKRIEKGLAPAQIKEEIKKLFVNEFNNHLKNEHFSLANDFGVMASNFDLFYNRALQFLSSIGLVIDKETDTYEGEDSDFSRDVHDDFARWTRSSKDSASFNLKFFLATIEDTSVGVNRFGFKRFLDMDEVYNNMLQTFSDREINNFDEYLRVLDEQSFNNPSFAIVADKLREEKKKGSAIPSEFVRAMSNHYGNFMLSLVFRKTDRKGNFVGYNFRPINSDRSNVIRVIMKEWLENVKATVNDPDSIVKEEGGKIVVDVERVKEIRKLYNRQFKDASQIATTSTQKFAFKRLLKVMGVSLSDNAFNELVTRVESGDTNILGNSFVKSINPFRGDGKIDKNRFVNILFNALESGGEIETASPITQGSEGSFSRFKALAKIQYKYTQTLYEESFTNVDGQVVHPYQMHTLTSKTINKLVNNKGFRDALRNIPFSKSSFYLDALDKDSRAIRLEYVDGLTYKTGGGFQGGKIEQLSTRDLLVKHLSLFQGTKMQTDGKQGRFITIVKSDKTTTPILVAPTVNSTIALNEEGDISFSGETRKVLSEILDSELRRITKFNTSFESQIEEDNKESAYSEGAGQFVALSFLNKEALQKRVDKGELSQELIDNLYTANGRLRALNNTDSFNVKQELQNLLEEYVKGEINTLVQTFRDTGILQESELEQAKRDSEKELTDEQVAQLDAEGVLMMDNAYLKTLPDFSDFGGSSVTLKATHAAADLTINYIASIIEQMKLISGDPAHAWKSDLDGTYLNYLKRTARDIAPRSTGNYQSPFVNRIYLKDRIEDSEFLSNISDSFKNIEITDAQEYTTVKEHLRVLRAEGKISIKEHEKLSSKIKDGGSYTFSESEIELLFPGLDGGFNGNVMKPLHSGNQIDLSMGTVVPKYVKTASFPLLPQFTKGMQLDKLRKKMEKQDVDRASYTSGNKLGELRPINIFNADGSIKDDLDLKPHIDSVSRTDFGIQQEFPVKQTNRVTLGSQLDKLLFNGLLEITNFQFGDTSFTGKQLNEIKTGIKSQIIENNKTKLLEELGIASDGDLGLHVKDIEKFKDLLKKEATTKGRNWPTQDIDSLELVDGKLTLPIAFSSSSSKIEALILSLISGTVNKLKVDGKAYKQGSSAGLISQDELSSTDGIITIESFDVSEGLQPARKNEKGEVEPAEIFVKWDFTDNEGNRLDINDFTKKDENGKTVIDSEKLPDDLLDRIGFRIPTQGHNSSSPVRVVGFIPDSMQDLVIIPKELMAQMGSDFDGDALYVYNPKTFLTKNGNLVKSDGGLSNLFISALKDREKISSPQDLVKKRELKIVGNGKGLSNNPKAQKVLDDLVRDWAKQEGLKLKSETVNQERKQLFREILDARNTPIEYTDDQKRALLGVVDFLLDNSETSFSLAGFAGTGKTTIIENIINFIKDQSGDISSKIAGKSFVLAPTNKAVLRVKEAITVKKPTENEEEFEIIRPPADIRTIHSALYGAPDEDGNFIPRPSFTGEEIVIIDESSMIDSRMARDIKRLLQDKGVKVIFIGDSFQLEPVGDDPKILDNPDVQMTQVVRQEDASPLLNYVTALRQAQTSFYPESDQKGLITKPRVISEFFKDLKDGKDTIFIVGKNRSRVRINKLTRQELFGKNANIIEEGERLISIGNGNRHINGQEFIAEDIQGVEEIEFDFRASKKSNPRRVKGFLITLPDSKVALFPDIEKSSLYHGQLFPLTQENSNDFGTLNPNITIATYGYAITAHKSQGSEWENVYVAQDAFKNNTRWLYTAATRSSENLTFSTSANSLPAKSKEEIDLLVRKNARENLAVEADDQLELEQSSEGNKLKDVENENIVSDSLILFNPETGQEITDPVKRFIETTVEDQENIFNIDALLTLGNQQLTIKELENDPRVKILEQLGLGNIQKSDVSIPESLKKLFEFFKNKKRVEPFIEQFKENPYQVLNNRQLEGLYFDIYKSVLTHPDVLEKIQDPLDKPDLGIQKTTIQKKLEDTSRQLSILSVNDQIAYRQSQKDAQKLVGVFALANTFNSVIQELEKPIQLMTEKDSKGNQESFTFSLFDGIDLTQITGEGNYSFQGEQRTTADNISMLLTAAVDNANNNNLGPLNITRQTAPVALLLSMLSDKGGKAVGMTEISRFMKQPIVEDINLALENVSRSQSSLAIREVIKKYKSNTTPETLKANENVSLTNEELLDNLVGEGSQWNARQVRIGEQFLQLFQIAEELSLATRTSVNAATNGAGKSISETIATKTLIKLAKKGSRLQGLAAVFDISIIKKELESTLDLAKDVFSLVTPYFSREMTAITNNLLKISQQGNLIGERFFRDIINGLKSFVYAKTSKLNISRQTASEERQRLLIEQKDKPSLAKRLKEAQSTEWGKQNPLVQALSVDLGAEGQVSTIRYQVGKTFQLDDQRFISAWENLLLFEEGTPQHELGKDLVKYSLLIGGRQFGGNFAKFIPLSWMQHIGMAASLRGLQTDLSAESALETQQLNNENNIDQTDNTSKGSLRIDPDTFVREFIRNHPQRAASFSDQQVVTQLESGNLVIQGVDSQFVSRYNSKEGKWDLFEQIDNEVFKQIRTAGNSSLSIFEFFSDNDVEKTSVFEENNILETDTNPNKGFNPRKTHPREDKTSINTNELTKIYFDPEKGFNSKRDVANHLLDTIEKRAATEGNRNLAKFIRQALEKFGLTEAVINEKLEIVGGVGDQSRLAQFNPNLMIERDMDEETIQEVILHELFHTLGDRVIDNPNLLSEEGQKALTSLDRMRKKLIKDLAKDDPNVLEKIKQIQQATDRSEYPNLEGKDRVLYWLASNNEFAVASMTNDEVRNLISNMEFSSNQSFFQRFTKLLKDLFNAIAKQMGITDPNNPLFIAMDNVITLIEENKFDSVTEFHQRDGKTLEDQARGTDIAGVFNDETLSGFDIGPEKTRSPVIESRIQSIKNKIFQLNQSINNINIQQKQKEEFKRANRQHQSLIAVRNDLQKDLSLLRNKGSNKVLKEVADRQLQWARSVSAKKDVSPAEIIAAQRTVKSWEYEITADILKPEQKEITADKSINKLLLDIDGNVNSVKTSLINRSYDMMAEIIEKETGKEVSSADLRQFKDIGNIQKSVLDLATIDNPLTKQIAEDLTNAKKGFTSRLIEISDEVDRFAKLFNGDFSFAIKEDGDLINQFTPKYQVKRRQIKKEFSEALFEIQEAEDSEGVSNINIQAAYRNYYEDLNEIDHIIDIRFFVIDGFKTDEFNNAEEYQTFLEDRLGVDVVNEAINTALELHENYLRDREAFRENLESEAEVLTEEELQDTTKEEFIESRLIDWELRNDPIRTLDEALGSPTEVITNFQSRDGINKLVTIPRKQNKFGESTEFYDTNFENLTESQLEFIEFYENTIRDMKKYLPDHIANDITNNLIPNIQKDLMEKIIEDGLFRALKNSNISLKDIITSDKIANLNARELKGNKRVDDRGNVIKTIPLPPTDSILNIENKEARKLAIKERSSDLGNILKVFSRAALNHGHLAATQDKVKLAFTLLKEAKEIPTEGGESMLKTAKKLLTKEDGNVNIIETTKNTIETLMNGERGFKGKESSTTLFKKGEIGLIQELSDSLRKEIFKNSESNGVISTPAEKRMIASRIKTKRDQLDKKLEEGEITKVEYKKDMDMLEEAYRKLGGKNLVWSKSAQLLLNYTQLLGMGYNLTAGIANIGFGVTSVLTHAAGNEDFTDGDVIRGFKEVLKSLRGSRNPKIANLIKLFDVLFEVNDVAYGKKGERKGKKYKFLSKLIDSPYEIQRRTEYFVQGLSMVAKMINTQVEVETLDGEKKTISLYDAFGKDGRWRKDLKPKEEWNPPKPGEKNKFTKFRNSTIQLNKILHGNYDPDATILIKKSVAGRFLMQFRSWIPYGFFQRIAPEYHDRQLGRTYKGRYTSIKDLGLRKSLRSFAGIALGNDELAFGKKGDLERTGELDAANMRKNFREMVIAGGLFTIATILKAGLDDDEEEGGISEWGAKVLINQFYRIEDDIYFYLSPAVFEDIIRNPVPAFDTYQKFKFAAEGTWNYVYDDDYRGDHPLKKLSRVTPLAGQVTKTMYLGERVIDN